MTQRRNARSNGTPGRRPTAGPAPASKKPRAVGPVTTMPTPVEHPKIAAAREHGGFVVHSVGAGEHTGVPGGKIVVPARPPQPKATPKPKPKPGGKSTGKPATRKATPKPKAKRGK